MTLTEQDQKDLEVGRFSREYTQLSQELDFLDKEIEACFKKIRRCADSLTSQAPYENRMNSFEGFAYPDHSYVSEKISERHTMNNKLAGIASNLNSRGAHLPSK